MNRRAGKSADTVALFPFLAVLLCTMGGLLVLLVVLSEAAKRRSLAAVAAVAAASPAETAQRTEIVDELHELEAAQSKLADLRRQADDQLRQEQARLTHSEAQERELEHDLAKLHIAIQQLEAAENSESVDRGQAAGELARLKQLVKDSEDQLEKLRTAGKPVKSYAIVPYKGANGTFRKPIFIECGADEVVIQPEGIHLSAEDFMMAGRPGNPLAAAIRAAREKLDDDARKSGQAPPEAYPLLLVRPEGTDAYFVAMKAVRAWDSDFGYEFIDADAKLKYPEPDPVLAEVMNHAVMQARDRMQALAAAAPSRFSVKLTGGNGAGAGEGRGGSGFSGGTGDGYGAGNGARGGDGFGVDGGGAISTEAFNKEVAFAERLAATEGAAGDGGGGGAGGGGTSGAGAAGDGTGQAEPNFDGSKNDKAQGGPGMFASAAGDGAEGASGGSASGSSGSGGTGGPGATATAGPGSATGSGGSAGTGGAAGDGGQGGKAAPGGAMLASAASGGASGSSMGSASMAGTPMDQNATGNSRTGSTTPPAGANAAPGAPSKSSDKQATAPESLAKTRGIDWALNLASQNASPVSRPIQAVVRTDAISVLPSRFADSAADPTGSEVRLDQPTDQAIDDLVDAMRLQIKSWGLAGQNMYWKPVLVVAVAPGAEPNARKLASLMEGSGVEVRLPQQVPQTATMTGAQEAGHATR